MLKRLFFLTLLGFYAILFSESCGFFSKDSYNKTPNTTDTKGGSATNYTSAMANRVLITARSYIGTPYKYGGTTKAGMDCSGLVTVAFQSVNVKLPRSSADMAKSGREVKLWDVRPGDLLFFITGKENKISHVGIVTKNKGGNDISFIHSADSGVREDNLTMEYYQKSFTKAMRPM